MEVYSSSSIGLQKMMIANIQKTLAFYPKGSRNLAYYSNRREQSLVVVNTLKNSGAEPQSGVVVTIVTKEGGGGSAGKDLGVLEGSIGPGTDCGNGGGDVFGGNNGNGSNGKWLGGGGGDNSEGGDEEEKEEEDDEFGPIMKFEDVMKETEARGASLPLDMLEAAKSGGLRELLLFRYLELQV